MFEPEGKLKWNGPTFHCNGPTRQHSAKNFRNDG